jgi:hypothetical protein
LKLSHATSAGLNLTTIVAELRHEFQYGQWHFLFSKRHDKHGDFADIFIDKTSVEVLLTKELIVFFARKDSDKQKGFNFWGTNSY